MSKLPFFSLIFLKIFGNNSDTHIEKYIFGKNVFIFDPFSQEQKLIFVIDMIF